MGAFSFAPGGKKRKFAGAANRPDDGQNAEPSPILGVHPARSRRTRGRSGRSRMHDPSLSQRRPCLVCFVGL